MVRVPTNLILILAHTAACPAGSQPRIVVVRPGIGEYWVSSSRLLRLDWVARGGKKQSVQNRVLSKGGG
jgi:hypothetical protein